MQAQLLLDLTRPLGGPLAGDVDPMGHHHRARHDPGEGLLVDDGGRGERRHRALHGGEAHARRRLVARGRGAWP